MRCYCGRPTAKSPCIQCRLQELADQNTADLRRDTALIESLVLADPHCPDDIAEAALIEIDETNTLIEHREQDIHGPRK